MLCNLCPRNCNAVRTPTHGDGFCGAGTLARVSRAAPHYWEEPCLSGTKGSGTIFFSGCSLGCVFCQNERISRDPLPGVTLDAPALSRLFRRVEALGVHNINLVTPTHFTPVIADALRLYKPSVPVVWNSGGYEKPAVLRLLAGLVDIFLPDFKYYSRRNAQELAQAPDYFEVALQAVKTMCEMSGPPRYDENGLMQSGTIVRHLVLPLRLQDTLQVLDTIAKELPRGTPVSLMRQYTPLGHTTVKGLDRALTAREYSRAVAHMLSLDLCGFTQEAEAVKESFIPDFASEESLQLLRE